MPKVSEKVKQIEAQLKEKAGEIQKKHDRFEDVSSFRPITKEGAAKQQDLLQKIQEDIEGLKASQRKLETDRDVAQLEHLASEDYSDD